MCIHRAHSPHNAVLVGMFTEVLLERPIIVSATRAMTKRGSRAPVNHSAVKTAAARGEKYPLKGA